ncbi:MAG: preprotein translocase subunit SecA [Phycisphaerae bacterium]|nr:preprotein translocase subunit SecA [Phycisphaerae bacterium]
MPTDIPLVGPIINKIFGTRNERFVRRYLAKAAEINELEPRTRALTDEQLRARFADFRRQSLAGTPTDELLVDALAVAREAMDRGVGIRNIFNPKLRDQFPADRLSPAHRELYEQTRAAMDAAEPLPPTGPLLGNTEPQPGWTWMDIPTELYDAVRAIFTESRPPFRARPFDVQLIGAMVLYGGKISEMKTGEGKTIVAPLAAYLACIEGWKVHVVTVNDYLVQRDRDWTYPFFRALGLTVGAIHPMHMQDEDEKRRMYICDVVYGTTAEFGFDYLRDNMKRTADQQVQRAREFAIVDEVDSILIDEARTPLIISGPAHEDSPRYELADQLARHLVKMNEPWFAADEKVDACKKQIKGTEGDIRNARDKSKLPELQARLRQLKEQLPVLEAERGRFTQYYEVEREKRQAHLTHHGVVEAQKKANLGSFYVGENIDMPHLLEQSLRAHVIYERDRDYIVAPMPDQQTGRTEPAVVIVDVNTGRPMVGRQWSDGLHQAVESKEGVRIKQETQTVASITIQNFFKMYKRLAGMTGTADTEAQEFYDIYKLDVVTIPTNLPVVRRDYDDIVYLTAKDKWEAIVDEIKANHDVGRPVLVGTTSVEKSEMLSRMLTSKHAIQHEVLNAKQHEREAHIVENAGQLGAVMIATNMAGRGTDIKLGKVTRQQLLDHWLRRGIAPRELTVEATNEQVRELVFRKIGARELGLQKRDIEALPAPELELRLLKHWAAQHTFADTKRIEKMSPDELRRTLDEQGRFLLHRIAWVENIEALGGLHVIGTERHESRRIDNQLRGRSGRQGDKGSTRFFVALDDDLMKMFAGNTTMAILSKLGMKEGDAIEHPMLSKSIVRAQRKVEERNFQIRKQILDYDEVMEHQRRDFYGQRQRVLNGRDVKGLIFDFIEDAAAAAVAKYLDPDYFGECVAEYAREKMGCSIEAARLRGKDRHDAEELLRREAMDDARHEINVTLGEYIPELNDEAKELVDRDTKGLVNWAAARFKVELTEADILTMPPNEIRDRLQEAAKAQIQSADLSDLDKYLVRNYGAQELSKWLKTTLDLDLSVEEIVKKESQQEVIDAVLARVNELYIKREIEYPVEFMMDMTLAMIRQQGPQAVGALIGWANQRYQMGWDESIVKTRNPQQIKEDLTAASRRFFEEKRLEKAIEEALAADTSTEALERHFKEKFNVTLPLWMVRQKDEDRKEAIRARVESILRAELLQFERFVLLEVLDPAWKDHLYEMDKLRDTINYRAFSQQDPRIEFKREGSRIYKEMQARTRARVAEYIFRLKLTPQVAPPPQQAPPPTQRQPAARPAVAPTRVGPSMFAGPGFDAPTPRPPTQA